MPEPRQGGPKAERPPRPSGWAGPISILSSAALGFQVVRSWQERRTLQHQSAALETLYDVGRAMASTLDFQSLLQKIMTLSMATIGSETASVMLADEETKELVLVCSRGLPEDVKPGTRVTTGIGVSDWVFRHGEPVLLQGSPAEDSRFNLSLSENRGHIHSALSVPLVGKQGPVGVLSLNNSTRSNAFSQQDLDLLTSLGTQAGIAVENARLHQQVGETNRQLAVTVERLRNLKSCLTNMTSTSLDRSLNTMLDAAVEGTGAVAGSLTVLDETNSVHRIEVLPDGTLKKPTQFVVGSQEQLRRASERPTHYIIRVLTAEGKAIGLLKLTALQEGSGFNKDDREFVDALVEHASIVVYNSMLYQEAEAGRRALQKAYAELQEKQDQLIHSEKLAAIGQLAAKICHEINNPLTAISGCMQMLRKKLRDFQNDPARMEPFLNKYLDTIGIETDRCTRITGDLLRFSRQQEPRFTESDLHHVLSHAMELVEYKYPSGSIALTADFDFDVPPLVADPQLLTQVFLNLMTNAAEAMPEGGLISVSTRFEPGDERENPVRIEIKDEGSGISEEDAARIFDPFYTTKESGTGLGLAISRGIIEKHRGSLHLHPADEGGTIAAVILPLNAGTASDQPLPADIDSARELFPASSLNV